MVGRVWGVVPVRMIVSVVVIDCTGDVGVPATPMMQISAGEARRGVTDGEIFSVIATPGGVYAFAISLIIAR
jgi:protein-S-isoprenylcysteine O-methyltransferase Ste14